MWLHLLQALVSVAMIVVVLVARRPGRHKKPQWKMPPQKRDHVIIHKHPVQLKLVGETIVPCCGRNIEDFGKGDMIVPENANFSATCAGPPKALI